MDKEVYDKCVEHIADLNNQIKSISRQKMLAEMKIAQLLQEKGSLIKSFEDERNEMLKNFKEHNCRVSMKEDVQLLHEKEIEDYAKSHKEMKIIIKDLKNENQSLRSKVDKLLVELESKTKELESEQNASLDLKQDLLNKNLATQFIANNNILTNYIDQCNVAMDVFNFANAYLMKTLNITLFPEAGEWARFLNDLQKINDDHRVEFMKLSGILHSKEELKKIENIILKLETCPAKPTFSLAESVRSAFQVMHGHMQKISCIPQPSLMNPLTGRPIFVPNPQAFPLNPGYQYPGRPIYPVHPQRPVVPPPLMSFNVPAPSTPIVNGTEQTSNSVVSSIVKIANEIEKKDESDAEESSEHSDGASLDEEEEKFSVKSSIKGSTTSSTTNLERIETPLLDGMRPKNLKYGIDRVMQVLRDEFIGIPELDIVESIMDIRKKHNNSLKGLKTSDIIIETKQFILKRQHQHICDYNDRNADSHLKKEKNENTDSHKKEKNGKIDIVRKGKSVLREASVPTKPEALPSKKTSTKPAWISMKSSDIEWKKETQEAECIICMELLGDTGSKKTVYSLKCKHSFHTECIRNWFRQSHSCPTCRIFSTLDVDFPPLPS